MKVIRILALGVVCLLAAACASTQLTAFKNQQYSGPPFKIILVEGGFSDLHYRQRAEESLCDDLREDADVICLQSLQVFFPGEQYTQAQINAKLAQLHVDGLLFMRLTGSGATPVYFPAITYSAASVRTYGNMASGSAVTETLGGNTMYMPHASFDATLYAIPSRKVAWYGTAKTEGGSLTRWEKIIDSTTDDIGDKLVAQGVLRPAPDD